jgi:hypothetical protein
MLDTGKGAAAGAHPVRPPVALNAYLTVACAVIRNCDGSPFRFGLPVVECAPEDSLTERSGTAVPLDVATDRADRLAYAVQLRLERSHGWRSSRAEEFCFDFKSNYQRIVYLCAVLGFSAREIADKVHREARTNAQAGR